MLLPQVLINLQPLVQEDMTSMESSHCGGLGEN